MAARYRLGGVLVTAALAVGGIAVTAPAASAVVLVSQPAARVHAGQHLAVGVKYRAWDGGPRAYRVTVLDPAGSVVFHRRGRAPRMWRMWRVQARRPGTWRTVYRVEDAGGHWRRWVARTHVAR